MPLNSIPPTTTVSNLEAKRAAAQGQCWVDVAFWGGVIPENQVPVFPLSFRRGTSRSRGLLSVGRGTGPLNVTLEAQQLSLGDGGRAGVPAEVRALDSSATARPNPASSRGAAQVHADPCTGKALH